MPTQEDIAKFNFTLDAEVERIESIIKHSYRYQLFTLIDTEKNELTAGYLSLEYSETRHNEDNLPIFLFSVDFIYIKETYQKNKLSYLFIPSVEKYIRKKRNELISSLKLKNTSKVDLVCIPKPQSQKFCRQLKISLDDIRFKPNLANLNL